MARNLFLRNLRISLTEISFWLDQSRQFIDQSERYPEIARKLVENGIWITGKTVAGYDENDFPELPPAEREQLNSAVADLLESRQPGDNDDVQANLNLLNRLKTMIELIRLPVLEEWKTAVEDVYKTVQNWCEQEEWIIKRKKEQRMDRFLGTFELDDFYFRADSDSFLLQPTARFISGGDGLIDLYLLPQMDSCMIVRTDNGWKIHSIPFGSPPLDFNQTNFKTVIQEMSRVFA